ncbi:copper resistance protein NlpE [Parafilimonas terrae]|uniref:NlpE N-terminal domain-containing protein n=1 Tax=Parafilimonas terrae TaxID=1465490 RepID=A0A1I5W8I6_9BACT|nr:copper resistance protein NlpE [Parafilimonas terrae]SFQ15907.1 NlpE N-terminal domain-containing protein [Parafilimonas terrae]
MKKLYFIISVSFLTACGAGSDQIAAGDSAFKTEVPKAFITDAEEYTGSLPCADCEGIDVSLQLNKNDSSYIMTSVYKGSRVDSSNNTFKDTGTWNVHGADTLYLSRNGNSVKYIKSDTTLIQLDGDGNRITGPLADKFILHKK